MKEYAVLILGGDWGYEIDDDNANWYSNWDDAFSAAEIAFDDQEVQEVHLTAYEDGEPEDFPLEFRREDGGIHQYKAGERLWA